MLYKFKISSFKSYKTYLFQLNLVHFLNGKDNLCTPCNYWNNSFKIIVNLLICVIKLNIIKIQLNNLYIHIHINLCVCVVVVVVLKFVSGHVNYEREILKMFLHS